MPFSTDAEPSRGQVNADEQIPAPIFIGGSPRAGTHAMGRLIAAHPRYTLLPAEARFTSYPGGISDLLAGRTSLEDFVRRFETRWWRRGLRKTGGLQAMVDERTLEDAVAQFQATFSGDPWGASRRLIEALLDPVAEQAGTATWVDVTGANVTSAPTLLRLFPCSRFINMVRDGRAVVASMLKKTGMTDDPLEALSIWEKEIRGADRAMRAVPAGYVLVMSLDDLAALDRERSLRRLVEFLDLDDDQPVRRHFEAEVSADAAHVGRWKARVAPAEARRVERRYRGLVRSLEREGVSWLPELEAGRLQRWIDPATRRGRRWPLRGRALEAARSSR